ncbi:choice-of-anchor J domain-containing protein [Flavobacterium pedocola]
MKNIFESVFILVASAGILTSCVNEDDFDIPPVKEVFASENFESIADVDTGNNKFIALPGWSNVSLNGGSELWEARMFDGEKYAQLSAFGTSETNMDTWLITPAINLDATEKEGMMFRYKAAYYNGQAVSVLISTDYDGSNTAAAINSATWTDANIILPDYLTSGYPTNFSSSPEVDLSSYSGNVYIAFRYKGSSATGGVTTTYQIDDIIIYENN